MSSIDAFDEAQSKAARVAGFTFLFGMAIVVLANYGINFRLIVPGNAVDTARNIMAHETLFRINIASNLIYVMNVVVQTRSALRDPQAGESEPCLGRGILQACICLDVGFYRDRFAWRSEALG